jgi:hypothetical protein
MKAHRRPSDHAYPSVAIAAAASTRRNGWCWPHGQSKRTGLNQRPEGGVATPHHLSGSQGHKRLRSATSIAQRREPQERRISLPDGQPDGRMAGISSLLAHADKRDELQCDQPAVRHSFRMAFAPAPCGGGRKIGETAGVHAGKHPGHSQAWRLRPVHRFSERNLGSVKTRLDDRIGVAAVTYLDVTLGQGLALSLFLVFAIWIGWRWLCRKCPAVAWAVWWHVTRRTAPPAPFLPLRGRSARLVCKSLGFG